MLLSVINATEHLNPLFHEWGLIVAMVGVIVLLSPFVWWHVRMDCKRINVLVLIFERHCQTCSKAPLLKSRYMSSS